MSQSIDDITPFRFLDLPANVRIEVYKFALGCKTLHYLDINRMFHPHAAGGRIFLCKATATDDVHFPSTTSSSATVSHIPDGRQDELGFEARHRYCFPTLSRPGIVLEPGPTVRLDLLLVCRRIYLEACTIPFEANEFTFSKPRLIRDFLSRLATWQSSAVKFITLYQTMHQRFWSAYQTPVPQVVFKTSFPRLRRIRVLIELCPADFRSHLPSDRLDAAFTQDYSVSAMGMFGVLECRNVEVAIVDMTATRIFPDLKVPSERELEAWARRLRGMVGRGSVDDVVMSESSVLYEKVDPGVTIELEETPEGAEAVLAWV